MDTIGDKLVVAAFNSCIDLKKWKEEVPNKVRERFKRLLEKNRVKMVCFSDDLGMGLRVYSDPYPTENDQDGDETDVQEKDVVDLEGKWVRCPGNLYQKKEVWIVLNENGSAYFKGDSLSEHEEDFAITSDMKDWTSNEWTGGVSINSRRIAHRFSNRDKATLFANAVGGVVIKGESI